MDEIEYKLKCNNPAVITDALGKVVTALIEKRDVCDLNISREYKFLKENCFSNSSIVSLASCDSIMILVKNDVIKPQTALSLLLSLLSNSKSFNGLVSSISSLLCLDVENKTKLNKPYINSFSLKDPQHPFITIMEMKPESVSLILTEIKLICSGKIKTHSLELLRPVFLWLLCSSDHPNIKQGSFNALQLLLECDSNFSSNLLLKECANWQQVSDYSKFVNTCDFYKCLCEWYIRYDTSQLPVLFPVLARISSLQLLYDCDPRLTYSSLLQCCHLDCDLNPSADWVVTILAHNITTTSSTYLDSLLTLCNHIVTELNCSVLSLNILKASMLQWLCYGSILTQDSLEFIVTIINRIENNCFKKNNIISNVSPSNNQLFQFFDEYSSFLIDWHKTWNQISNNNDNILSWLQQLMVTSDCSFMNDLFLPILGVFLMDLDFKITLKTLEVLQEVIKENPDKSITLLPVLLHYMTVPRHPNVTVDVLKVMLKCCICKVNTPLVIFTITNLYNNKGVDLSLVIHLLTLLEEQQPRTYTYLQEYLLEKKSQGTLDTNWEVEIAKAAAIKSVCKRRAAQHGPEFISILSQILNRCSDDSSGVASALVLDALSSLWLEHIVSPVSTWNALSPKLLKEERPLVQVSLCKLLGNVPALYRNNPEYNDFTFECLATLWRLTAESDNGDVINGALKALSHYSIKDMHLKQFPDVYKRDLTIKSDDPDTKPEDILDHIPYEIWPTVFRYMNHNGLKGLIILCSSLMRREINDYRSGVYHTGREDKEPSEVTGVGSDSVVKGLMHFIKSEAISPTHKYEDMVLLAILDCMIEPYSKPLPPIDWCFLQQLFHQGSNFRMPSLLIGAKQAVISGSARRFVENYLSEFRPADNETFILDLFEALPSLAQTVSPQYIGSVVDASLNYAYELYLKQLDLKENFKTDELLFTKQLKFLNDAFASNKMSEENCTVIADIIEEFYRNICFDDLVWEVFGDLCAQLTADRVDLLTSVTNWLEFSKDRLKKAAYIRCKVAVDEQLDNPLNWLNEVIDNVLQIPTEHVSTLHNICPVLMKVKTDKISTLSWFLQLMLRTQELIAKKVPNEQSIMFLCDILMMCVILFSNRNLFSDVDVDMLCVKRDQRFSLFSNSLIHLMRKNKSEEWQTAGGQIIEWLHYARSKTSVPLPYRRVFYSTLLSCKNSTYLNNKVVKAKMLSIKYE